MLSNYGKYDVKLQKILLHINFFTVLLKTLKNTVLEHGLGKRLICSWGKRILTQQFIKEMEILRGMFPRRSVSFLHMTHKETSPFHKNVNATKIAPRHKVYGFVLYVANLWTSFTWPTVLPGLCRLLAGMSCCSLSFCCSSSSRSSLQEGRYEHKLLVTCI